MNRTTRCQAAILRDHHILLIQHREHTGGRSYWLLPGGGAEPGESEEEAVRREVREETHLEVQVVRLLLEMNAIPGDMYQRYKTYECRILEGQPRPGYEPEEEAANHYAITEVRWFDLRDETRWPSEIFTDPITYPALCSLQTALGYPLTCREPSMAHADEISLDTPRLTLRSMRAQDLDALLRIFSDPRVMAAFNEAPFNRGQMQAWLQRNLEHQAQHGYGLFAMILKASGELVGDCGLELMEVSGEQVAELGYDLRSDYWNQGLASEAAAAVRDYAFDVLGLPRLVSLVRIGNLASQRVAQKTGMHQEGEIERYGNRYWMYDLRRGAQGDG